MDQKKPESDQEIMAELRAPIDELIDKYFATQTAYQKLRVRQLAWQAVDILVRTGNIADLEQDKNVKRILKDIKELGASEEFIDQSLSLAVSIYKKMQLNFPGLLKRYRG